MFSDYDGSFGGGDDDNSHLQVILIPKSIRGPALLEMFATSDGRNRNDNHNCISEDICTKLSSLFKLDPLKIKALLLYLLNHEEEVIVKAGSKKEMLEFKALLEKIICTTCFNSNVISFD